MSNDSHNDIQPEQQPPPTSTPTKRRISPAIILFLITGIMGLAAAGIILLFEGDSNSTYDTYESLTAPRAIRDWQAPDFDVQTLDGDTVSLADYRGRVIFLNFWWTGCPPCIRELPALQAFNAAQRDAYGDDGAIVLAINQGESPEQVREFLDELGVEGITILMDRARVWGNDYGISGFPTTFIIDANGMVRFRKLGELDVDIMNEYVDLVAEPETPAQG